MDVIVGGWEGRYPLAVTVRWWDRRSLALLTVRWSTVQGFIRGFIPCEYFQDFNCCARKEIRKKKQIGYCWSPSPTRCFLRAGESTPPMGKLSFG